MAQPDLEDLVASTGKLATLPGTVVELLYLLDEPTVGQHLEDVTRLIEVLQGLVTAGHSVIVIEHHLDIIKSADWVIDLGPEGGAEGGEVIVEGTVEDIIKCEKSYTGKFLQNVVETS